MEVGRYDSVNRNVTVSWSVDSEIAKYRFLKMTPAGIWARAADIVVEDGAITSGNATLEDGTITYKVQMVAPNVTNRFRILAFDADDVTILDNVILDEFVPVGLQLESDAYNTASDSVTLTAKTISSADTTYQWYRSTTASPTIMINGALADTDESVWTAIEGATSASYTVADASDGAIYRLVATNGSASVAYAAPLFGGPGVYQPVVSSQTAVDDGSTYGATVVTFNAFEGDDVEYQLEYYNSKTGVWNNVQNLSFSVEDGVVTATKADASYASTYIRVRAVTPDGVSTWSSGVNTQYDATNAAATIAWDAMASAETYAVRISKDGGATWSDVPGANNLAEQSWTLNGIYAGKSYGVRVYGYNADGKVVGYRDTTLAPVNVRTDLAEYAAGDVINATLVASSDAEVTVKWYFVTEDGDVEIEDAEGLLAFTTSSEWLEKDPDIRVVVTGAGYSAGSSAETLVEGKVHYITESEFGPYYTLNRNLLVSWNYNPDVAKYRFLKLNDAGIWARAADIVVEDGAVLSNNATLEDGMIVYTSKMLNAGTEGVYRIAAFDAEGEAIDARLLDVYNAVGVEIVADAYGDGATLTAKTSVDDAATYQWYRSTDANAAVILGGPGADDYTWTAIEGATSATYTVDDGDDGAIYKLVVSNGFGESVAYAAPLFASAGVYMPVVASQTAVDDGSTYGATVVTFNAYEGDAANVEYQLEYYNAESGYWNNLQGVAFTIDNGVVTATKGDASYASAYIRVRAVTTNGVSIWSSGVDAQYNATNATATIAWDAIGTAETYAVRISKDGGATWGNVPGAANLDEQAWTLKGIYPGKSYGVRVYGYDADGNDVGYRETILAPVKVRTDLAEYAAGDVINATLVASSDAEAIVKWYLVTENGDVEIEDAEGLLSYTTSDDWYEQDPTIRVVVTGIGYSAGSSAEALVEGKLHYINDYEFGPYYTLNRNLTVSWNYSPDVAKYRFLKLNDEGVWARAADVLLEDGTITSGNATLEDGMITYTSKMLNAGSEGAYRILAFDADDNVIDKRYLGLYSPIGVELDADASDSYEYNVDTLTATVTPEADVTYQWYRSTDASATLLIDGPAADSYTWTPIEGATGASYTVVDAPGAAQYKLVVTDANNPGRQTVVYASSVFGDAFAYLPHISNVTAVDDGSTYGATVVTFNACYGAGDVQYQIEYFNEDSGVWNNLQGVSFGEQHGIVTATKGDASYADKAIRVRAVASNGVSLWDQEIRTVVVTTGEDVVDPHDGATSLREAVAYHERLLAEFPDAVIDDVTFDDVTSVALNDAIDVTSNLVVVADPANKVVIDASGSENGAFNVVGSFLSVAGLTFTGGVAEKGSAIRVSGADAVLNVNGCSFIDNDSSANVPTEGGVIYGDSGSTLRIYNSNFTGNAGMAVAAVGEDLDFINNTIYAQEQLGGYGLYYGGSIAADPLVANSLFATESVDPNVKNAIWVAAGRKIRVYNSVATEGHIGASNFDPNGSFGVISAVNLNPFYIVAEGDFAASGALDNAATGEITDATFSAVVYTDDAATQTDQATLVNSGSNMYAQTTVIGRRDVAGRARKVGTIDIGAWEYSAAANSLIDAVFIDYLEEIFEEEF
ncbi:MAG: hypothetical protein ACOX0A_10595 [Thermoguttaceae bacterium]